MTKKIAILIQIGNHKVWKKMIKYFKILININPIFMIHFNKEMLTAEEINDIKSFFENYNTIYTYGINRGMDIYGFFCQIEYIIKNNIVLDYILKLQTKSIDSWRDELIYPLCGNNENLYNCLDLLKNHGLICSKKWFRLMDHFNTPIILNLFKEWNIKNNFIDEIDWNNKYINLYDLQKFDPNFYITYPYNKITYNSDILNNKDKLNSYAIFHWLKIGYKVFRYVPHPDLIIRKNKKHIRFSAGTIFWIQAKPLINFFKEKINFKKSYSRFEPKYFKNEKPTFTHSWERLFAIIIDYSNKTGIGI